MEENFEINIAHLYPEMLNLYADFGNICALTKRLEWRNIKVNVDKILMNDEINYKKYDIFFIGGGQDKQQISVSNELKKHKDDFKKLADDGVVMLGICGGYQLLSNYYQDTNGNKISGIGLLNAYTLASEKRAIGNITVETNFLNPKTLVGFENHIGLTYLENGTKAIGKVIVGTGNNRNDKTEGAMYNNVFGTYLHGALLPKNPAFCDYLLKAAISRKLNDNSYQLPILNDDFENIAHKMLVKKDY